MPRKKAAVELQGQQKLPFAQKKRAGTHEPLPPAKKTRSLAATVVSVPAQPKQKEQEAKVFKLRPRNPAVAEVQQAQKHNQKSESTAGTVILQHATKSKAPSKPKKEVMVLPKILQSYNINGEEFEVGEDVYIIATDDASLLPDDTAEDLCVACGKGHQPHTIVECEHCLGGYHIGCLKPKLTKIPEDVWVCPCCACGEPPSNRPLSTAYEKFLFAPPGQEVLHLAQIASFAEDRTSLGSVEVCVRYYCRPEATHLGRQPHHATREVFLTSCEHWEPIDCVFGSATVCRPQDFASQTGTEVYMCEYEYDEQWKRFRRLAKSINKSVSGIESRRRAKALGATDDVLDDRVGSNGGSSDNEGSDFDGVGETSSSSEDEDDTAKDVTFKPIYAFWAEKGMLGPKGYKGKYLPKAPAKARPTAQTGALNKRSIVMELDDDSEEPRLQLVGGAAGFVTVPSRAPLPPLAAARRALSLASVPASLQCRDAEKLEVTHFVQEALQDGNSPGVLYVCGVPGTGKTAIISQVLKDVMQQQQQQQYQSPRKACRGQLVTNAAQGVQVVSLNALSLPSPIHVYSKLWEKLMGQRLGPGRALAALEQLFSGGQQGGSRSCMTLLVVDEIDVLITKDQSVLYNLFEWPMRQGTQLAVIGISNTHDLDERVLPRISSRLASAKLAFSPYPVPSLVSIMEQRLELAGCRDLFDDHSLSYTARKVASSTGDVRRALELLRRATEIAEAQLAKTGVDLTTRTALQKAVTMQPVITAMSEMYGAPHMQFLRICSRLEKLALAALIMETRATSRHNASIQAVHHRLTTHVLLMCHLEAPLPEAAANPYSSSANNAHVRRLSAFEEARLPPSPLGVRQGVLSPATLCRVIQGLASRRLLISGPAWQGIAANVALSVHKDDVATVIKEDPSLATLHGQL